jgi:hypothetical protein
MENPWPPKNLMVNNGKSQSHEGLSSHGWFGSCKISLIWVNEITTSLFSRTGNYGLF